MRKARIQLLDSMNSSTTAEFVKQLRKSLLQNKIKINLCKDTREVDIDIPLVLLVQNCTRIGTDIDAGISCLKGNQIHPKLVAIIVIHAKEQHALPRVSAINRLNDERYADYGLLADFGFYKGNIYDCSLERNGVESIMKFIKENAALTPTPRKGSEDHLYKEDPATSPKMPFKKARSSKRVQMLTTKRTDSTDRFEQALEKKLKSDIDSCIKEDDFQPDVPIILLVQKMTEVEQDIKCALSELKEIPRQDVAIAVIHINEPHELPKLGNRDMLNTEYGKLGLVVDFAFYKNEIYDHQMNTDSLTQLSTFIQERSPCTSMSVAVSQEEAQTDNINDEDIPDDFVVVQKPGDCSSTQFSTVKHEVQMLTSKITYSADGFKQDLEKKLHIEIGSCVKEDDFQPDVPIILLVQKMTVVEQDIKCALSELKEVSRRNVAVVVIHINEPHALPSVLTVNKLPEEYNDLGLVVDFAYYKYDIYNHEMNTDSLEKLSKFIQTEKVARKKNMSSSVD